jgi:hypothetical protein
MSHMRRSEARNFLGKGRAAIKFSSLFDSPRVRGNPRCHVQGARSASRSTAKGGAQSLFGLIASSSFGARSFGDAA